MPLIETCPVLGIPLYSDGRDNQNAPSLDRFIPSLGYVKGNVFVISRRANVLKGDATIEEVKKTYISAEGKKLQNNKQS